MISTQDAINQIAGTTGRTCAEAANVIVGTTGLSFQNALNRWAGTVGLSIQNAANNKAGSVGLSTQQALNNLLLTPSQITGLDIWLESDYNVFSDAGTTPAAIDGSVQQWTDRSAVPQNFSQATAGSRPLYKSNIFNGKPGLLFDGVDDDLTATVTAKTAQTVFVVVKGVAPVDTTRVLAYDISGGLFYNGTAYGYYANEAAGIVNIGGTNTNAAVLTLNIVSAASATVFLNGGTAVATFDPNDIATTGTALHIGSSTGFLNTSNQYIGAVIRYNSSLASADQKKVESYLGVKYGITVT